MDKVFLHFLPNFCHFSNWSDWRYCRSLKNHQKLQTFGKKWRKTLSKNMCPIFFLHQILQLQKRARFYAVRIILSAKVTTTTFTGYIEQSEIFKYSSKMHWNIEKLMSLLFREFAIKHWSYSFRECIQSCSLIRKKNLHSSHE